MSDHIFTKIHPIWVDTTLLLVVQNRAKHIYDSYILTGFHQIWHTFLPGWNSLYLTKFIQFGPILNIWYLIKVKLNKDIWDSYIQIWTDHDIHKFWPVISTFQGVRPWVKQKDCVKLYLNRAIIMDFFHKYIWIDSRTNRWTDIHKSTQKIKSNYKCIVTPINSACYKHMNKDIIPQCGVGYTNCYISTL